MTGVFTKSVLVASGALLGVIGGSLVIAPQAFLEMSHVIIDSDPGLLSELSAPAGLLILASALMIMGAIKERFTNIALTAGAAIYGSYAVGRLLSMLLHGLPSSSLILATLIELVVAGVLLMLRLKSQSEVPPNYTAFYRDELIV